MYIVIATRQFPTFQIMFQDTILTSDCRFKSMSQELGTVVSEGEELDFKRYPIGSFLKIIPYHVRTAAF